MPEVRPAIETFAKIKVIGAGGSGNSSVNRMVKSKIKGIDFIAVNTDVQALNYSLAANKIHLGKTVTRGLGAGMNPEVGRAAAEESTNEIRDALKGSDMVFITCGLGGGTGSGASPVIAEIAKECGALTVAVVTKPFMFEGAQRRDIAERAYAELASQVDTVITIPNDRVLQIIDKKTSITEAFETIDDILRQAVQGISEVITVPGLINVDFADVKSIMHEAGSALMGIGHATGENRAIEAAKQAIQSPLLEVAIDGAKGILFTVTGGANLSMYEVSEAAKLITANADANARVIFGTIIDESLKDEVKICVIATGFEGQERPRRDQRLGTESAAYSPNKFLRKEVVQTAHAAQAAVAPAFVPPERPKTPFQAAAEQAAHLATPQQPPAGGFASIAPQQEPVRRDVEPRHEPAAIQRPDPTPAPAMHIRRVEPEQVIRAPRVADDVLEAPTGFSRREVRSQPAPAPRPEPVVRARQEPEPVAAGSAEEDLEIPAFIRRKMG